jgi:hypothetical protein
MVEGLFIKFFHVKFYVTQAFYFLVKGSTCSRGSVKQMEQE